MSFRDIKGQDSAIAFLKDAIENKRVHHAYIFLGPSGVGKRSAALNYAKALNCESASAEAPCDQCSSCRKIDGNNHPDVFTLVPEKEGASIKIEKIRGLIKNIGLKPYEGRKKVYIIDEAGSMTPDAANALLKTLEEPPSESVLILIAETLPSLFSTITSRSQIVKFFPLKIDALKELLIKEHNIDDVKAHILSHLACGSLGRALRYKDADIFDKREALINSLLKNDFFDLDFDDTPKNELKLYLDMMLTWYRDLLTVAGGSMEQSKLINIDRFVSLVDESRKLKIGQLEYIIKSIISTNRFLDENANPKLAMSVLGATLCTK